MNVFWTDPDLDVAARNHPTKYTKLILEAAQCLCSAMHNRGLVEESPYGAGYRHHPISRWAGDSQQNWFKLRDYAASLHDHFYGYSLDDLDSMSSEERWSLYDDGEAHKSMVQVMDIDEALIRFVFPDLGLTARPKCVLDFCEEETVTETYRKYIVCVKSQLDWFEWSDGKPDWYDVIMERYRDEYRKQTFMKID